MNGVVMERPELGLPSSWELTPLTHSLITPEIASLFHIIPEPPDHLDLSSQLNQLWCSTICFPPPRKDQSILKLFPAPPPPKDNKTDPSKLFPAPPIEEKNNLLELDPLKLFPAPPNYKENNQLQQEPYPSLKLFPAGKIEAQSSNSLKLFPDKIEPCDNSSSPKRKIDLISSGGGEPSTILDNNNNNNTGDIGDDDEQNGTSIGLVGNNDNNRAVKRPRLVWTPQLHKRFVDVIEQLGIDKAVPKTIMEMMNVDGLTRENVASHLQKYRLYLKRMKTTSLAHARCTEKAAFPKLIGRDHDGGGTIIIPSMGDDDQCPPLPLPLPHVSKNNNAGSPPTNAGDIINLGGGGGNIFSGRQVMLPHQQQLHSAGYSNSVPPPLILPLPRVMGTGTAGSVIGSTGYRSSYGHFGMPTSAAAAGGTSLWD